jgi:hypothetical protein
MKSAWHKLSNHRWLQAVVFAGVLNSVWPWLPMEPAYDITEIASAGVAREIVASNMNDAGVVVGQFSGQRSGVFVFAAGAFKELDIPSHPDGNKYVYVKAINNHGTVVGQIQTAPKSGPDALVISGDDVDGDPLQGTLIDPLANTCPASLMSTATKPSGQGMSILVLPSRCKKRTSASGPDFGAV